MLAVRTRAARSLAAHRELTAWLGRQDSNLCISESDPLLSIMACLQVRSGTTNFN
jgi:hypothetical protein